MDRKDKDIELWRKWKQTKSPVDLEALLAQLNPIIQKEINRWSGALARPIVELEARRIASQAFDGYNENAGAALSTYLTNSLAKLSRITYSQQGLAYVPEYKRLDINKVNQASNHLESELGRPPNNQELSEHLGWSRAALVKVQKLNRSEHTEFQENVPSYGSDSHDGLVDLIYHDLNPSQKVLFEHITGYGGKPELNNQQLMDKLKLTQGQLSYERRKLKDVIEGYQKH